MKQHVDPAEVDILVIWANTPLALVHEILQKGDFAPAPEDPVAEKEKDLGEMTPLEKAIYTAKNRLIDANNAKVEEVQEKGEQPDMQFFSRNHANEKALANLMWACIQMRLDCPEADAIGLREGYKIVQVPSRDRAGRRVEVIVIGDPFMMMAASMMADLAGKKDK